jgi:FtsH-binding integral membrane protein
MKWFFAIHAVFFFCVGIYFYATDKDLDTLRYYSVLGWICLVGSNVLGAIEKGGK